MDMGEIKNYSNKSPCYLQKPKDKVGGVLKSSGTTLSCGAIALGKFKPKLGNLCCF